MAGSRNKYLDVQDEQQRNEKLLTAQVEFLRKTLAHVSVAATGLDEKLDAELIRLKEMMRGAAGGQVVEQMQRVQKAVNEFEGKRQQANQHAAQQFSSLVDQLQTLSLPSETRKKLAAYKKSIQSRLDSWRVYPELVAELSAIQTLALTAASQPQQGLWQRLKGGTTLKGATEEVPAKVEKKDELEVEKDQTAIPQTNIETPDAEDSYEQVAKRINRTLNGLVSNIEPNELVKHKVDIVQSRLSRGMDWFALAITLEDIRDILMQRYLSADKEFSEYLKKVNDDLNNIREKLGLAVETEAKQQGATNDLSNAVSQHVNNMQNSLAKTENVNELKQAVTLHLDEIQNALQNYHQQERGTTLTDQLQNLVERVQSIESESEKTKVLLEEERYKATHDSLTQLPNREAYAERAWQEFQRFKRYKRALTIAVCDIDYFKKINDNYGHQAGDKVLKLFAKLLSTRMREVDFVGRYGGEEFVILLPETTAEQAMLVLDKIRSSISKTPFRFKDEPVNITVSFGISEFTSDDHIETAFARADKALYKAKNNGRNCCIVS